MADLQGSLAVLSLPGLLQLLAAEERSGRLELRRQGEELGSLWLDDGLIVHAESVLEEAGEVAALALVGIEEGGFRFHAGEAPARASVRSTAGHLLLEAARLRDHAGAPAGRLVAEAVPVLAPEPPGGSSPRFDTLQWRLLASVDGRRDVASVAAAAGVPLDAAADSLEGLLEIGVLRLVESPTGSGAPE